MTAQDLDAVSNTCIVVLRWTKALTMEAIKPPKQMRYCSHTSKQGEGHAWFCSNEPICGFWTQPESIGTCHPCLCDYVPSACGWQQPSWSNSKDPQGVGEPNLSFSRCAGLCYQSQIAPGPLHESLAEWHLFIQKKLSTATCKKTSVKRHTNLRGC